MISLEKQLQNSDYENLKCPCGFTGSFDICDNDCSTFTCRKCTKRYHYIENDIKEGHHPFCGKGLIIRTSARDLDEMLQEYTKHVIRLEYKYIKYSEGSQSFQQMVMNRKDFFTKKSIVEKDTEFQIPQGDYNDIVVGLYSEDEGEYKLYTENNVIFTGPIIKNVLMYFPNFIPMFCLSYEKLYIQVTCDIKLITSIVNQDFRKQMAFNAWKVHDNLYIYGGETRKKFIKNDIVRQLPYLPNCSLISKIANMNNIEILIKFPSMKITDEDKKTILTDLDLLTLYIRTYNFI